MRGVAAVLVVLAACGGGGGGDGDDDALDGPAGCTPVWYADAIYEGASAAITGGQLVLRAPMAQGRAAIEVAQPIPDGNFDVRFEISSFTAGGPGAFVGAVVQGNSGASDEYLAASLVTSPAPAVRARTAAGSGDTQPSALTAATVRFVRSGTDVTITASTADATATATSAFDYPRLVVGIQLGSTSEFVGAESTATIDAMTVTRGGFASDSFDCDSIRTSFD